MEIGPPGFGQRTAESRLLYGPGEVGYIIHNVKQKEYIHIKYCNRLRGYVLHVVLSFIYFLIPHDKSHMTNCTDSLACLFTFEACYCINIYINGVGSNWVFIKSINEKWLIFFVINYWKWIFWTSLDSEEKVCFSICILWISLLRGMICVIKTKQILWVNFSACNHIFCFILIYLRPICSTSLLESYKISNILVSKTAVSFAHLRILWFIPTWTCPVSQDVLTTFSNAQVEPHRQESISMHSKCPCQ